MLYNKQQQQQQPPTWAEWSRNPVAEKQVSQLQSVAQALYHAIHVAGVAKVSQAHYPPSIQVTSIDFVQR